MATLFLYTFFVGFGLTLVSALLGAVDAGIDHSHGSGGDLGAGGDIGTGADFGDAGVGPGHGPTLDTAHGSHGQAHGHSSVSAVSPVNFQTVMAFLMGFGGVGYLFTRYGSWGLLLALPAAASGGLSTSWLIYRFLRFLVAGERPMAPTEWVGTLGRLTVGIREGGTGEMVYSRNNSRMVAAARSADGTPISRGEQVLVLRYEKGVAYVQPWREIGSE